VCQLSCKFAVLHIALTICRKECRWWRYTKKHTTRSVANFDLSCTLAVQNLDSDHVKWLVGEQTIFFPWHLKLPGLQLAGVVCEGGAWVTCLGAGTRTISGSAVDETRLVSPMAIVKTEICILKIYNNCYVYGRRRWGYKVEKTGEASLYTNFLDIAFPYK